MNKKRLFGFFIFFLLFPLLFSINVKGVSNVNYRFNQNTLLAVSTPDFNQEFNLRDVSVFQGHYNDTHGINNEIVGTSNLDIGFVDELDLAISTNSIIAESLSDHRNFINLIDGNSTGRIRISNIFDSAQTFGTIEFWINTNDVDKFSTMELKQGANTVGGIRIQSNIFEYFDGSWNSLVVSAVDDIWYHIRLDFESTLGSYQGLSQYDYKLFINNTEFGDFDYASVRPNIDKIRFSTGTGSTDYNFFIDGVAYSWITGYNIGFNIIPILESTPFRKEVEKAEFALSAPNTFTTQTDTKLDGFTIVEVSDAIVRPLDDPLDSNDKIVAFSVQDAGDVAQIVKDDLGITGINFIHTQVEASMREFDGSGGGTFQTSIRSLDDTLVGGFKFDSTGAFSFNIDVWITGWITIAFTMNAFDIMLIDHYVDYELDIQITDITINGTFINRTINPIAVLGKSGFNKIEVDLSGSAVAGGVWLDSLGIFTNAVPITEGLGYSVIHIGSEWRVKTFNLFTKQINGFVHIASTEGFYQVEHFPNTFTIIEPFQQFNNVSQFENVYFSGASTNSNFSFVFTINGSQFSISELLIQGVSLNQQNNVYNLQFEIGNISINDNFFFVENNQLKFTHTSNDDNKTEFMLATFDINNFLSEQKGIRFQSQIDNNAIGNFTVDFTSGSQIIPLSVLSKTQNIELIDSKTVNQFSILITDNNNNNITGQTTGFIGTIIIFPNTDLLPNFLIFSLLGMLIPLIIILIPTIALRELYGSVVVVPIFLLMSFILLFGGILPIWLLFIIMVSSSLFILKKNKSTID